LRPRSTRFFLAAAAALLAGITACESLVTDPIPYGKIHVRAVGRDSAPLPGIEVELYTGFAPHGYHTTDANGRTTFSRVPMQQYGILMKPGANYGLLQDILPETSTVVISGINVTAATDTVFTFVFTRKGPGAIEARVEDQDSLPVVGVKVGLYNFAGEVDTRLTNVNGIARFEPVPYGNWGVYIDPPDSLGAPNGPRQHIDGLAIELGTVHSLRFEVNRCAGALNVSVFDQDSLPVANYPLQLYTHVGAYRYLSTAANGVASFTSVPCGNYGVLAEANAEFSVDYTRGSGFQDGLGVTNGTAVNTQLRVTRN
jgi:hypothetical protein